MPIYPTRPGVAEKSKLTTGFLKRKVAEYEVLWVEIEVLTSEVALTNLESETENIVECFLIYSWDETRWCV